MSDFHLDLQDTATAYIDKSDAELKEKYRLFKLLNSPFLNALGTRATNLALSLGLPVEGLIKSTIFEQFCGGETIEECEAAITRLHRYKVGTILDYSVEGMSTEGAFDKTKDEIIRTIERAKGHEAIPFSVFKVSGVAPLGTLERLSLKKKLDAKSQAKCERIFGRVHEICAAAYAADQPLFIDAEESWIQDAIDRLAVEMMEKYNRERPIIFTTLQLYRTDRLQYLKEERRRAKSEGYFLGVKLVRGAYMEKERERAKKLGYPSPIQPNKTATDHDYNLAIDYCLKHLEDVAFVAATHNEESTRILAEKMFERRVPPDHPHVFFSQLFGMGDNISYKLASLDYHVSKYVPYGPVADSIPYLIRRAEENSSAAGHVSRELTMIKRELKRRNIY
jgi:proline dehydrogenase